MQSKVVHKFGNSGHVIVPREYVGKRVRFIIESKRFEDIQAEILHTLRPHLEHIIGVYLYGSYARNEQTLDSDIDILVVANTHIHVGEKKEHYSVICITVQELEQALRKNAVLILPILKEARAIINAEFLDTYNEYSFTKQNTKAFIEESERILALNKKGLALDFELGSLVYSMILRVRGLLIISLLNNNESYATARLHGYLYDHGFPQEVVEELYRIYGLEREGKHIQESSVITKETLEKLYHVASHLLEMVRDL